jgi:hypothetical protein
LNGPAVLKLHHKGSIQDAFRGAPFGAFVVRGHWRLSSLTAAFVFFIQLFKSQPTASGASLFWSFTGHYRTFAFVEETRRVLPADLLGAFFVEFPQFEAPTLRHLAMAPLAYAEGKTLYRALTFL